MKFLVLASLSLFATHSFAQITSDKPFQLAAGNYTSECWYVTKSKNAEGSAISGEGYEKAQVTVVVQGNVNTEFDQTVGEGTTGSSVTVTTTTDLGNGKFKQLMDVSGNDSFDGKTESYHSKFESTLSSEQNRTRTLTVKKDDEVERPGVGETFWKQMPDGRIVMQGYLLEKRITTTPERGYREDMVSNSTCIYTVQK